MSYRNMEGNAPKCYTENLIIRVCVYIDIYIDMSVYQQSTEV